MYLDFGIHGDPKINHLGMPRDELHVCSCVGEVGGRMSTAETTISDKQFIRMEDIVWFLCHRGFSSCQFDPVSLVYGSTILHSRSCSPQGDGEGRQTRKGQGIRIPYKDIHIHHTYVYICTYRGITLHQCSNYSPLLLYLCIHLLHLKCSPTVRILAPNINVFIYLLSAIKYQK